MIERIPKARQKVLHGERLGLFGGRLAEQFALRLIEQMMPCSSSRA
ncbi:MAG: hypothetical protein AB1773_15795 [Pseudomonadota bacterium]